MFDPSKVLVKKVGADKAALVGEILGDAFSNDPVAKWISPDPEFMMWGWPLMVPFLLPYDEVYITEDGLGAAMWVPPGAKVNIRPSLVMLWNAWWLFGVGSIIRFFKFISIIERYHPKDNHYYLFVIGIRSASQGQGIGSVLLEHVLQKCDRQKVGAYLETSTPRDVVFYKRHGFEVRNEVTLPRNGPTLWLMYRNPRTSSSIDQG